MSFKPADVQAHADKVYAQKWNKYGAGLAQRGVAKENFHVFYFMNLGAFATSSLAFIRKLFKEAPRPPADDDALTPFSFISSFFLSIARAMVSTIRKTLSL